MADKHLEPSFGRDGVSGMLDADRALRAREISPQRRRPTPTVWPSEDDTIAELIDRAAGRRRRR